MKPKPFWLLNHFTVPVSMGDPLHMCLEPRSRARRVNSRSGRDSSVRHAIRGEAKSFGRNSMGEYGDRSSISQGARPFRALPDIKAWHGKAHRAGVFAGQRLAVSGMSGQRVLGQEIIKRQVGGVAVIAVQDDVAPSSPGAGPARRDGGRKCLQSRCRNATMW